MKSEASNVRSNISKSQRDVRKLENATVQAPLSIAKRHASPNTKEVSSDDKKSRILAAKEGVLVSKRKSSMNASAKSEILALTRSPKLNAKLPIKTNVKISHSKGSEPKISAASDQIPVTSVNDSLLLANEATNEALDAVRKGDEDADLKMAVMKRAVRHAQSELKLHQQSIEVLPQVERLESYSETLQTLVRRYPSVRRALTMPASLPDLNSGQTSAGVARIAPKTPSQKMQSKAETVEIDKKSIGDMSIKKTARKFVPARKDAEKRKRLAAKKKAFADFGALLGRRGKSSAPEGELEPVKATATLAETTSLLEKPSEDALGSVKDEELSQGASPSSEDQSLSSGKSEDQKTPAPDLEKEMLPTLSIESAPPNIARFVMDPDVLLAQQFITTEQRNELREHINNLPPPGKFCIFLTDEEIDRIEPKVPSVAVEVQQIPNEGVRVKMTSPDEPSMQSFEATPLRICSGRLCACLPTG